MKKVFFVFAVMTALLAQSALAGQVTARAVLRMDFIGSMGIAELNIREEGGKIQGFNPLGNYNLSPIAGGYAGWVNFKQFKVSCSDSLCADRALNNRVNLTVTNNGTEFAGAFGGSYLSMTRTQDRIEIRGENTMYLTRNADGTYSGQGFVGRKSVSATLSFEGEGEKFVKDPALLLGFMATFFAERFQ